MEWISDLLVVFLKAQQAVLHLSRGVEVVEGKHLALLRITSSTSRRKGAIPVVASQRPKIFAR
ncbi:MAG: hypothetical protein IH856_12535 [Deltaproteobacteria bacterium]|nr:hypothetical protein [Deltaproteobacteria bacterium]